MARIYRTPAELRCLEKARRNEELTHSDKCAAIYTVQELKGYKDALQRDGKLDDDAISAIKGRLSQFEALFGRKIT
jgi:hypothetical protein